MVLASSPVDSERRLAARPVGAHSSGLTPLTVMMVRIEFTKVVLPTPGPPVITSNLEDSARRMASFWLSARWMESFCSTQGMALSASKAGRVRPARIKTLNLGGDRPLGVVQRCQEHAGPTFDGVGQQYLVGDFLSDRRFDDGFRDVEQLHRQGHQFGIGQPAVALARGFGQCVGDTGLGSQGRIFGDADLLGNRVGREKADTANVLSRAGRGFR
jgi:hypothetical protein